MSGDSLPQKHFTVCPSMTVPLTETMAWAALSWEENLKRNTAVKSDKISNQTSQKINIIIQVYLKIRRNITVKTTVISSSFDELVMES